MTGTTSDRRAKLLELATGAGIRLRNVPEQPSEAWLTKAEQKVTEAIAARDTRASRRRQELIASAANYGIRLRNVPERPSLAWLDRAEAKIGAIIEERRATRAEADTGNRRLDSLLFRARRLGVKVKNVPAKTSSRWLAKLEGKLTEIERARSVPPLKEDLAAEVDRLSVGDPAATVDGIPPAPVTGQLSPVDPEGQERLALTERVEQLEERSRSAGVELGRIPPNPTEEWLVSTEAALDAVLEDRRRTRRAERSRQQEALRARVKEVLQLAAIHGVDVGQVPPFPTSQWLARTELMIIEHAAREGQDPDAVKHRIEESRERRERMGALVERAGLGGYELGDVPPDPTLEWIEAAEARADQREAEASEVLAFDSEVALEQPRLVFEEGTLQEETHPLVGEITIGRNRSNTIQVRNDAQVSRRHVTIWSVDDIWYVRDDGSTRGTLVGDTLVDGDHVLADGDVLQVGETLFVFRL